jgi:hypothetical protein
VIPTFFKNLRKLSLNTSSFMKASRFEHDPEKCVTA